MKDEPTGLRVCAHANDPAPMHFLRPGEKCPGPRVLQLMEDVVADLDRIGREYGRAQRDAALADLDRALDLMADRIVEHIRDEVEQEVKR